MTHSLRLMIRYNKLCFIVFFGLFGCVNQPQSPAPVRSVTKDYSDYSRGRMLTKSYRVQPGDTLYSIAWESGVDYKKIIKNNRIKSPYTIYVGQELDLSDKSEKTFSGEKNVKTVKSSARQQKNLDDGHKIDVDSNSPQGYRQVQAGQERSSSAQTKTRTYGRVKQWLWPTKGQLLKRFSTAKLGSKGIDISGKFGQAITASADGKVVYAGSGLRGYGELIIIKHSDEFLSAYAHNSAIRVTEGQWVKAGQLIANMGSTGADTVKLHFEVRYKGKPVDPLKYLPK